jgi:hypothetical protein
MRLEAPAASEVKEHIAAAAEGGPPEHQRPRSSSGACSALVERGECFNVFARAALAASNVLHLEEHGRDHWCASRKLGQRQAPRQWYG